MRCIYTDDLKSSLIVESGVAKMKGLSRLFRGYILKFSLFFA